MEIDFETKLAAAGEMLEKLAAEQGLDLNDFTEDETLDLLSTIMGEDGGGSTEPEPKVASMQVPAAPTQQPAQPQITKVAYPQALAQVMKVAQANGYDLNQASPEELHSAVEEMQQIMADPQYETKQAALQEKIAEADALGRVMAHAYVDELGKIAATQTPETPDTEKKAAFVRELRAKLAGELPPQFRKEKKDGDDEDEKGEKDEEKKKEAFAKQAAFRASEHLIASGINPQTGEKFASEQEQIDAGAALILQQKGYLA